MSIQHHSAAEQEAARRFLEEAIGTAERKWPQGRISGDDDGETAVAIAADHRNRIVRIKFTKPMDWLGLDVKSTRHLAALLTAKADELESPLTMTTEQAVPPEVAQTKKLRQDLDGVLQSLKRDSEKGFTGLRTPDHPVRSSRERSLAVTKIQEAIMWLGMDLKAINEEAPGTCPTPYPQSYNPASPTIEPTADGLKL